MPNPLKRLHAALSIDAPPLLVGAVAAHNADGTSTIVLPGGGEIRARGTGIELGAMAFVQSGEIRGAAPDLPVIRVEV
jgi:hypothetical protein